MARLKVLRDPVYTNIELDSNSAAESFALDLINAREVQRLRHVRQLALANFVYHGTEHSRFSHTLGVMHLAKRLYTAACANSGIPRDERSLALVLAGAILHDTGHPPFSHAVEKVLGVDHEAVTAAILRGDTDVHRILVAFDGEQFVEEVANHITGSSDAPTASIISSQLDADRMDYVLRDGYHAGIPNSRYDLERILQLVSFDEVGPVFDYRAQLAIEGYFIARYHLYLQLYYHRTNRAAEVVLRGILRRAKELAMNGADLGGVDETFIGLFGVDPPSASVQLSDHDLWTAFRIWSRHEDRILSDLSKRLLLREPLKAIELKVAGVTTYAERKYEIDKIATDAGFDPAYYVALDTAKDTPYKIADVTAGGPQPSVRIRNADGAISSLETTSGLIEQLQHEAYQKVRLCVPADIRDVVEHTLNRK